MVCTCGSQNGGPGSAMGASERFDKRKKKYIYIFVIKSLLHKVKYLLKMEIENGNGLYCPTQLMDPNTNFKLLNGYF